MSNTIFNLRILFWHLKITNQWKISFDLNRFLFTIRTFHFVLLSPIALYDPFNIHFDNLVNKIDQFFRIRLWFQNLNENKKKLFHFRGAIKSANWNKEYFCYEVVSRFPSAAFEVYRKGNRLCVRIGVIFFTIYLDFPFLKILRNNAQYGFYYYSESKDLVFNFGKDNMSSSSKDPWYYSFRVNIRELFFGRSLRLDIPLYENKGTPITFKFRNREYQIEDASVYELRQFYSYIPFSLYNKKSYYLDVQVKNPPMTSGKWGDDACYGLSKGWQGTLDFSWDNRKLIEKQIVEHYLESVKSDLKRYGRASDDTELDENVTDYEMVYPKPNTSSGIAECSANLN